MTDREYPHYCFADDCTTIVDRTMLMCKTHWFQVPFDLRAEVNESYRNSGVGTQRYVAAVKAAREAVKRAPLRGNPDVNDSMKKDPMDDL